MSGNDIQRLIEAHDLGRSVFYTTPLFWDCEQDYIHPASQEACPACGAVREDQPDARVDEVLRRGSRWPLELGELLAALAEQAAPGLRVIPF
jgi:hypothetical protein